jgi:hypothetical protein
MILGDNGDKLSGEIVAAMPYAIAGYILPINFQKN